MDITPKAAKLKTDYSSPCSSVESSPCEYKEKHQPKLSASLRERLKRSRRSFISPLSVAKRLCVDDEEKKGQQVSADSREPVNNPPAILGSVDVNRNEERTGSETSGPGPKPIQCPSGDFAQRLRKENDLTHLQTLIDKWRSCAQAALYELQSEITVDGRKASLSELIDLFSLDDRILHFDRTEEDFTT